MANIDIISPADGAQLARLVWIPVRARYEDAPPNAQVKFSSTDPSVQFSSDNGITIVNTLTTGTDRDGDATCWVRYNVATPNPSVPVTVEDSATGIPTATNHYFFTTLKILSPPNGSSIALGHVVEIDTLDASLIPSTDTVDWSASPATVDFSKDGSTGWGAAVTTDVTAGGASKVFIRRNNVAAASGIKITAAQTSTPDNAISYTYDFTQVTIVDPPANSTEDAFGYVKLTAKHDAIRSSGATNLFQWSASAASPPGSIYDFSADGINSSGPTLNTPLVNGETSCYVKFSPVSGGAGSCSVTVTDQAATATAYNSATNAYSFSTLVFDIPADGSVLPTNTAVLMHVRDSSVGTTSHSFTVETVQGEYEFKATYSESADYGFIESPFTVHADNDGNATFWMKWDSDTGTGNTPVQIMVSDTDNSNNNKTNKYDIRVINVPSPGNAGRIAYVPEDGILLHDELSTRIAIKTFVTDDSGAGIPNYKVQYLLDNGSPEMWSDNPSTQPVTLGVGPAMKVYEAYTNSSGEIDAFIGSKVPCIFTLSCHAEGATDVTTTLALLVQDQGNKGSWIRPIVDNTVDIDDLVDKRYFQVYFDQTVYNAPPGRTPPAATNTAVVLLNQNLLVTTTVDALVNKIQLPTAALDTSDTGLNPNNLLYVAIQASGANFYLSRPVPFTAKGNPPRHPDYTIPRFLPAPTINFDAVNYAAIINGLRVNIPFYGNSVPGHPNAQHVNDQVYINVYINAFRPGTDQAKPFYHQFGPYNPTSATDSFFETLDRDYFLGYTQSYSGLDGQIEIEYEMHSATLPQELSVLYSDILGYPTKLIIDTPDQ